MPTITIRTDPIAPGRRRAIAVRLTRWLSTRGHVEPAHVLVNFEEPSPQSTYTGGLPVEAFPRRQGSLRHAVVTCRIGPDRDERFRTDLAHEVADALGVCPETALFYLEFRATSPADVYIVRRGGLERANERSMTNRSTSSEENPT
ncbi:hypothetical protein [Mangrovihabitans endophyticus]|uniref:Uncharacterized protein n=1 Tax=Mangrovihabitans endophyticus TaxID=1751298 RepID=A0A8J3BSK5_9ACTN|nr:hypothetical protein [Mangrovihabitans endophyticus]GGK73795.1 hypothetical protein GCM10012284_04640 [Mangrovihabitans endophyticus]